MITLLDAYLKNLERRGYEILNSKTVRIKTPQGPVEKTVVETTLPDGRKLFAVASNM